MSVATTLSHFKRPLAAGIIVGVLAAGWVLICGMRPASQQDDETVEVVPEVLRSKLTLTDGRLFESGKSEPFTGLMLENYDDRSPRSRSQIFGGRLNGTSEGWATNGTLVVLEHFRDGVSHGLRTKWHPDGKRLSEAPIVDGKIHGTFRRWHENGQVSEVIEMSDGIADGISRAYYSNGFLKARVQMKDGEAVEQKFWEDGEFKENVVGDSTPETDG